VEVVVAMLEVALTNARSEVETATSLIAENNVTSPPKFRFLQIKILLNSCFP
jgi:hypothetical protein